ncbi:pilus assembly protein PilP [Desulfobotulus mexicanus]|nr:pilus assembly protein PilP [Desulfobotulus mexicanus]
MLVLLVLSFGCGQEPPPPPAPEKAEILRRSIIFQEAEKDIRSGDSLYGKTETETEYSKETSDDGDLEKLLVSNEQKALNGVKTVRLPSEEVSEKKVVSLEPVEEAKALVEPSDTDPVKASDVSEMDADALALLEKKRKQESKDFFPVKDTVSPSVDNEKKPAEAPEAGDISLVSEEDGVLSGDFEEIVSGEEVLDDKMLVAVPEQPVYKPEGRIDPFRPLIQERPRVQQQQRSEERPERRIPQTPLEKVDLSQLKLVGIVRSPMGPRAMVEESSGRGYVVTEGTYMGLHGGRVTAIERERLVVTEIVENLAGEFREEEREMRLQKPTGE